MALCQQLKEIKLPGLELFVEPIREHRLLLVLRGENLGDLVNHTDPLHIDPPPLPAVGADEPSRRTADAINNCCRTVRRPCDQASTPVVEGSQDRATEPAPGSLLAYPDDFLTGRIGIGALNHVVICTLDKESSVLASFRMGGPAKRREECSVRFM